MARQQFQSKRPRRVARWMIEVSATLAAMGVAIAVVTPIAGAGDNAHREPATTAAFARLSAIPSHNGIYQASLVRSSDANAWTVNVLTASGTAVGNATLALESWMPDDDRLPPARLRVTQNLGGGRYRVEGLRFDRRGWWNVKLQISAPNGMDSLAFNLVR